MLWGAFNNASTAMNAFSWDMGTIGQNIANVNTTGYKNKETDFRTQLSEHHAGPATETNGLNIFGVGVADRYNIAKQGVIKPTDQFTDMAINGKGFFIVSPPSSTGTTAGATGAGTTGAGNAASTSGAASPPGTVDLSDPSKAFYTRDGSFLQLPDNPAAPTKAYFVTSSGDYLMGYMADASGAVPTTGTLQPVYTQPSIKMAASPTTKATIVANIPDTAAMTQDPQISTAKVTDDLGVSQDLTLVWNRTAGDTWTVTPNSVTGGTITAPATTYTVQTDANDKIIAINGVNPPASTVQNFGITWASGTAVSQPVDVNVYKPSFASNNISISAYDSQSVQHVVNLGFEKTGQDTWFIHVGTNESGATSTTAPIPVTFNGDGSIASPLTTSVNMTWANGQTSTVNVDLNGVTQLAGGTQVFVKSITTDGFLSGQLTSAMIDPKGEMVGSFDNGQQKVLFKVPVATFVAPNSLEPLSGNLFARTQQAGDIDVRGIDQVPGDNQIVGSAVETSTVDIGNEFTQMILTQKAYSMNSTVFKTADEMTTVARDLQT